MADYSPGFRSLEDERADLDLRVEGRLPGWLDGALIRNGPAKFEVGGEPVAHWFDGLAMLHRFAFGDGVTYTNRFLRSREYRAAREGGMRGGQFATAPSGFLRGLVERVIPTPTDNANVNVTRAGDQYVAITETPIGVEFDPETLETLGRFEFDDGIEGHLSTAHPHRDPRTGEVVNCTTEFGRTSRYRLHRRPEGATEREPIGAIEARRPAYVHSFGLTRNYAVLAEFPFVVNPLRFLRPGGGAFIENYEWRPDRRTRFHAMDRETGEVVAAPTGEPAFCFHHVNAYEDGDEIVVDLVGFPDPDVVEALYLEDLRSGTPPALEGSLRRYRVPLAGGEVGRKTVFEGGMTLPRIAPDRNTREYRYAYGQGSPDGERPPHLVKVDVETGAVTRWVESGTYPGEPVVVRRPGGEEDDGAVLSVALDTDAERSALLVLDAASFEEVARARLPHAVPFDFHGQFFPGR